MSGFHSVSEPEESDVTVIKPLGYDMWLKMGIYEGYCSDQYCDNHAVHAPEDEDLFHQLLEEYEARDFCWPVVRLRTLAEDI